MPAPASLPETPPLPAQTGTVAPRTYLNQRRHLSANERTQRSKALDYWDLIKPEITFLVGISALAGFFLGTEGSVSAVRLFHTLVGVTVAAAGCGMLNHYLERHLDPNMRRTANRPLAAGRVSAPVVLILGAVLILLGTLQLWAFINGLTAFLAALTAVTYLGIYTPLKRVSKYNTLIGCIPGALPALGGWTAATGSLGAGGWALFAVLFFWQMPHFLSLAWMYRKDYDRGRFAMLPVVEPEGHSTARQTVLFTVLVIAASVVPFALGLSSWLYLAGVLLLGVAFLKPAIAFYRSKSNQAARKVLLASVLYIPLFVVCILIDRFI